MKKKATELVERLHDQSRWPGFESIDHFRSLQKIASEAKERGTSEGVLASILIIQQLVEEILRLLLDEAEFFMQLKLYPLPYERKQRKKMTFGGVISELEATVWFQNKRYIIARAKELNETRNGIVHRLTKPDSLDQLNRDGENTWNTFHGVFMMGLEAHRIFQHEYAEFYRDPKWPPEVDFLNDDGSIDA